MITIKRLYIENYKLFSQKEIDLVEHFYLFLMDLMVMARQVYLML